MDNELAFVRSQYWKDFEKYLQKLLDNEINRLIYSQDSEDKSVSQGKAQAYKTLLKLREQV